MQCFALLTDREVRQDLGNDGALVRLELRYSRGTSRGASIRPVFGFIQSVNKVPIKRGTQAQLGETGRVAVQKLEDVYRKNPGRVGNLAYMVTYLVRVKQNLPKDGDLRLQTDRHCYMEVIACIF